MEEEPRPGGVELARQARAAARERADGAVREMAAQFGSRTLARLRNHPAAQPDRDTPRTPHVHLGLPGLPPDRHRPRALP
jgi:hypothetical protein